MANHKTHSDKRLEMCNTEHKIRQTFVGIMMLFKSSEPTGREPRAFMREPVTLEKGRIACLFREAINSIDLDCLVHGGLPGDKRQACLRCFRVTDYPGLISGV